MDARYSSSEGNYSIFIYLFFFRTSMIGDKLVLNTGDLLGSFLRLKQALRTVHCHSVTAQHSPRGEWDHDRATMANTLRNKQIKTKQKPPPEPFIRSSSKEIRLPCSPPSAPRIHPRVSAPAPCSEQAVPPSLRARGCGARRPKQTRGARTRAPRLRARLRRREG